MLPAATSWSRIPSLEQISDRYHKTSPSSRARASRSASVIWPCRSRKIFLTFPATSPEEPSEQLLRQIMADVEELVARHGWETAPRRRMAFLLGEALELAEEVLQLPAGGPYDGALRQRLGREIYDFVWNACDLARLTGIAQYRCGLGAGDCSAVAVAPPSTVISWALAS
jgi:NTP pyrophosphatase (non-canonical NTP hydrolase)